MIQQKHIRKRKGKIFKQCLFSLQKEPLRFLPCLEDL